jgi:hypothetical protein
MNSEIKMNVNCPHCGGTGIYSGMSESDGVGVVCHYCKGTGCFEYKYKYTLFNGIKKRSNIKRVYRPGSMYTLGLGKINIEGVGEIDMDKEGVSYSEFLEGKEPKYIETLQCPMSYCQHECHEIEGFVEECNNLNGSYINYFPDCKHQSKKSECWERFNKKKETE